MLSGAPGFFFMGLHPRQTLTVAGIACIANGYRAPVVIATGSGPIPCTGVLEQRFDSALLTSFGFAPGARMHVQAWYRDPAHPDGRGVGLSNGLAFTVCP